MYQLCDKINSNQHGKMNIFTCSHAHSAAVSGFKWHFCPDKYWKWTRLPLWSFLRLHRFAAHMLYYGHIYIRTVFDHTGAMLKSYFQYFLFCWGVERTWRQYSYSSIPESTIELSKTYPNAIYVLSCHSQIEKTDCYSRVERVGLEAVTNWQQELQAKTDQKGWNAFNKGM